MSGGVSEVWARVTDYPVSSPGEGLDSLLVDEAVILDGRGQVVAMDRFNRVDWSIQTARIQALAERDNNVEIHIDSTGAGEPIYEAPAKAGTNVRGYTFTQKSKAALNLAIKLERCELILPTPELCPELVDEHAVSDQGNVRAGALPTATTTTA